MWSNVLTKARWPARYTVTCAVYISVSRSDVGGSGRLGSSSLSSAYAQAAHCVAVRLGAVPSLHRKADKAARVPS